MAPQTENKAKNALIDEKTIEQIKEELIKRKEQIIKDLEAIATKENKDNDFKVSFPEYGDKNDENAQEINEYSTNLATEQVLEKTLRDINGALERIENGTYGICKYCKNPINIKRLKARPVASACVTCKTKLQSSA